MRRTVALFALSLVALAVGAAAAEASVVMKQTHQSPRDVEHYWTAKRMQGAVPADRVKPQAGKPGGSATTTSASSFEVPYSSATYAFGKVFFTNNSGVNYVCSGTALVSTNKSVVWTAGHCVNEGPGAFYKNFLFVPGYRDGAAPVGKFAGPTLLTNSGWQTAGDFGVDSGAAVVAKNANGQTLDDVVQEQPIVFNSLRNQSYTLYGYPAAKRFSGGRLRACNTSLWGDDNSSIPATMGAACDMTGGSSGGAWLTSSGAVASNISYGYNSLKNVLFGPHLESAAQSLYNSAQSATAP